LVLVVIAEAAVLGPLALLKTAVAGTTVFYVVFLGFKIALWWAADDLPRHTPPDATDGALPRYTIIVPLRGEAAVVAKLVEALCRLRYPVSKLEIFLLLEDYDLETQTAVEEISLPDHFQVVVVPDVGPRTKPKACNLGYARASGDRRVIFDAEDRPERDQLLRTVAAFRAIVPRHPKIGCLQAQLAFWNPRGSWVSSFYWAEYVVHFQRVLPGLARLGLIPPLGGTSNHFTAEALRAVAEENGVWEFQDAAGKTVSVPGPWDPYNVTEDADLAFRLALAGYRIGMFSSVTYEEALDTARKAKNQRSRWLQGYVQNRTRSHTPPIPVDAARWTGALSGIHPFMLGTPASLLLNPLLWAMTIFYIISRVESLTPASTFIHRLFPSPVYYPAMMVAVGQRRPFLPKADHSPSAPATSRNIERRTRPASTGELSQPAGIRPVRPAAADASVVGVHMHLRMPSSSQAANPVATVALGQDATWPRPDGGSANGSCLHPRTRLYPPERRAAIWGGCTAGVMVDGTNLTGWGTRVRFDHTPFTSAYAASQSP
jgi:cellulose synthase/poly-beta-1,6-N-acetylglucosamine synthase-like glycosyltransferase